MKKILIILVLLISFGCQPTKVENDLVRKTTSSKKSIVESKENVKPSKVNDVILVYSFTGDWKVNAGTNIEPDWGDDYCTFEIFYSKSTNSYELKMDGFQPKNHNAYETISKLYININNAKMDGLSYKEIRVKYLN